MTRVLWIRHSGLKAHDAKHPLSPTTAVLGENGEGKSTVIEALRLLAQGEVPGVDRNSDGVMSLARGDKVEVEAEIDLSERGRARVTRSWTRGKEGRIHEKITNSSFTGSLSEHRAWLFQTLGGYADAFRPEVFWSLTPAKMRERLLRVLPRAEKNLAAIVPADCPTWAMPKSDPEPDVWVRTAIDAAKYEVAHRVATLKAVEVELEAVGEAWTGERPLAPIQAQLKALRGRLLDIRTRDLSLGRLVKAEGEHARLALAIDQERGARLGPSPELARAKVEVEGLGETAAMDVPSLVVARLFHAVVLAAVGTARNEAREIQVGIQKALEQRATFEGDIASHFRGVVPADATAVEILNTEVDALKADLHQTAALKDAAAEAVNAWRSPQETTCPHCQGDLSAFFLAERKAKEQALRDLTDQGVMLEAAVRAAGAELGAARQGLALQQRFHAVAALSQEIEALQARRRLLPEDSRSDSWPIVDDAEAAVEEALDQTLATYRAREMLPHRRAEIAKMEREQESSRQRHAVDAETRLAALAAEIETLKSEISRLSAIQETIETVEASIRATEGELAEAVKVNEKAARLTQAEADKVEFQAQVEAVKKWLDEFRQIEADLVKKAKVWIEGQLSTLCGGALVEVKMYDERGNDDCKFTVDGVAVKTLSPGARLPFMAALVVALASSSSAGWKPLLIDELEHVSLRYRDGFLRAIVSAVENGQVSQAIVAGCCDTVPDVPGLTLILLEDGPKLKAVK